MAKRKREWPPWWEWELKLIPHMKGRLAKRKFTEIELRRMMEHATNFRPDYKEGRFGWSKRGFGDNAGRLSWSLSLKKKD